MEEEFVTKYTGKLRYRTHIITYQDHSGIYNHGSTAPKTSTERVRVLQQEAIKVAVNTHHHYIQPFFWEDVPEVELRPGES